jgi:peptide/nickel transport system substrate-binding protein
MSLRARVGMLAMAAGLVAGGLLPAAAPAARAADPVVLWVGTTENLDSANPWTTYLPVGSDVFQLTYNLLTEFDEDAKPARGFAETWDRARDKVTFHIPPGMKWSDGEPATSRDVCYSWGLAMAAIRSKTHIGAGYLDPTVKDAGVTKIECPDETTFIAWTTDQSDRIFQVYIPILPRHVFATVDYRKIADQKFDPPLVGTGPYTLAQWQTGQFARFVRNPNYAGKQGYEDQVVIRFFSDSNTMVRALQANELDYARRVDPDQLEGLTANPPYKASLGKANRWTELAFNTYGTGTRKSIRGGGPSTAGLLDVKFRDALGYAVDKKTLVDRVLGGYGDVGTTNIPPALEDWHVEPDHPRTFDIELATQKLDAAGYKLDTTGRRLDKQRKPISLRLYTSDSDENYRASADLIEEWYGRLGIDVETHFVDTAALGRIVLPPEGGGTANYDVVLWGWSGNPDPNALLQIFRCDAIGDTSDSQYCNPAYDKLYNQQLKQNGEARRATLARVQNLVYDQAPYDILYYDWNLDAYRTDKFAGWATMPANGTPFFTYGVRNYTLLTDARAEPEPTPGATDATGAATDAPSAEPSPMRSPVPSTTAGASSVETRIVVIVVVLALVVVGTAATLRLNRRPPAGTQGREQ